MFTLLSRPTATVTAALIPHNVTSPAPSPTRAFAVAPRRVVCPTSSSSQRPASSSPRSNRVPVSNPHTPPTMLSTPRDRQAVKPATVPIWCAGPSKALIPTLDPNVRTNCARASGVP